MATTLPSQMARSWWILVLYGVIGVIFGLVAIARPGEAALALAWTIGVMAIAEAVISVVAMFSGEGAVSKGWLAFYALVSLVFGVLAVMNPLATAAGLVIFLGAWLLISGIFRIVFAIRVRKQIDGEWMIGLSGLLAIVLGAMFMAKPLIGALITTFWIGAIALVYGVMQIAAGLRLRKMVRIA